MTDASGSFVLSLFGLNPFNSNFRLGHL